MLINTKESNLVLVIILGIASIEYSSLMKNEVQYIAEDRRM